MELRCIKEYDNEGNVIFYCDPSRDDEGNALLEMELKERINKLAYNIQQCGSYSKLIELGGSGTKAYLNKTRRMLKEYLVYAQLFFTPFTADNAAYAVNLAFKDPNLTQLVIDASWEKIQSEAAMLREQYFKCELILLAS